MPDYNIVWKVQPAGKGFEGTIVMKVIGPDGKPQAPIKVSTKASSKRGALARAATVADSILSNPILQAALPPGAPLAIQAVKAIATSTDIGETLSHYAGDGAKRLADALGF